MNQQLSSVLPTVLQVINLLVLLGAVQKLKAPDGRNSVMQEILELGLSFNRIK